MSDYTPNALIPYVPEGTLDPAAGLNEALDVIDALIQCSVVSMALAAPPGSPTDGARYIVAASATGAWSGKSNYLARYASAGAHWVFYAPGAQVSVVLNDDDGGLYAYTSGAWSGAVAGGVGSGGSTVVVLAGSAYSLADLTNTGWHVFTSSTVTLTIDDEGAEPMPTGAEFGIEMRGATLLSIVHGSTGITLYLPKGGTAELETNDFCVLKRTALDVWKLIGSTVLAT